MKVYEAIVWVGEAPGVRVTFEAEGALEAVAHLKAEYGEEAIFTTWNEEDRHRPR